MDNLEVRSCACALNAINRPNGDFCHFNNLLQKDRRLRRIGATPQPRKINSPLIALRDGFDLTPPPTDLALNPLRANFHPPIRRIAADKIFIFGPSVSVTLWTDYHTPRIPRRRPSIKICTNKSPIILILLSIRTYNIPYTRVNKNPRQRYGEGFGFNNGEPSFELDVGNVRNNIPYVKSLVHL